jgi:hypothetical protein
MDLRDRLEMARCINVYTRSAWLHSGRKSAMVRPREHEPPVHPHTRRVGHEHLVRGGANDVGTATKPVLRDITEMTESRDRPQLAQPRTRL